MARYLRFFTAVGDDQPTQWEEEELHMNSEELSSATGQNPTPRTFRESLKQLYGSDRFQVVFRYFKQKRKLVEAINDSEIHKFMHRNLNSEPEQPPAL